MMFIQCRTIHHVQDTRLAELDQTENYTTSLGFDLPTNAGKLAGLSLQNTGCFLLDVTNS